MDSEQKIVSSQLPEPARARSGYLVQVVVQVSQEDRGVAQSQAR